jgi:hypothetical protein
MAEIKEILKSWVAIDEENRKLKQQIKDNDARRVELTEHILKFMRDNSIDNFDLSETGNLTRHMRTSKPPIKRNVIKTNLLIQFADQPERIAEVLRKIEGIPEGSDDMTLGGTQREVLVRRVPKKRS